MDDKAWLDAIRKTPEDRQLRLVYADWLEERGHPGADYLRAELALANATGDEPNTLRRKLLKLLLRLPAQWRDRFEQPDLLLASPTPFAAGWYAPNAQSPRPYRSLANLDSSLLTPDLPWLSGGGTRARLDQEAHELEELTALAEILKRADQLKLILPPGFVSFARDFPRRGAVAHTYFEVCLHDAVVFEDFPRVGDGYLILFFADMNYGNPHQLAWSLYLVPGVDWHCVVVFELRDAGTENCLPDDPELIFYCAPSFQAFLYRWWLGGQALRA
jgi:uncharacterized protein (TIGR02996 family)